jgi:hypothetical protein
MPNLRSQSITADGIELVASDGRSFVMTRAEVLAHFQAEKGARAARIAATIDWVKASITAALGPEQVPQALIDFDFDDVQGLKNLGVRS